VPAKSNIERVAEEGFTLAGPYYNQNWQDLRFVHEAAAEGFKFTYQLRPHPSLVGISLGDRPAAIAALTDAVIAANVRTQVEAIMDDPLTGTNPTEIQRVIRHDVYLAMVRGIDSLNIFSMFENRPNLTTHNEQFEAYGSVADDLTGSLNLQKAFLFGEARNDLAISVVGGDDTFQYTHTDGSTFEFPTLNYLNAAVGSERYLILVNSTEAPMQVSIAGLPSEYIVDNLFAGSSATQTSPTMSITLDTLGVTALRLRQAT
jgi:hypothetical protein